MSRTVGLGTPMRGLAAAGAASWHGFVKDKDLTAPPGSPTPDDSYIVASPATGAWSGQEDDIATWDGSQWIFETPEGGWAVWVEDETEIYVWNGASWGQESFGPHAATHEDGGPDEISVAALSGLLADPQTPLAHDASHMRAGGDPLSQFTDMLEPTGFADAKADVTLSWSDVSKVLTVTPVAATFEVWVQNKKYTKTGAQTKDISGSIAEGLWYFYYDNTGTLQGSQTPWNFNQHAPVALVHWDNAGAAAVLVAWELHGIGMDWRTHEYLHSTEGTRYEPNGLTVSGDTAGDGSAADDAQVAVSDGSVWDEDIEIDAHDGVGSGLFEQELSPTASIPVFYRDGVGGLWRKVAANAFPVKQGAARIQYNLDTAGTWTTPDVTTNGRYMAMWLFATNNKDEPIIAILGQREDITFSGAQDNNQFPDLAFGTLPLAEMKVIARLILQTSSGYGNTPHARTREILDLRTAFQQPTGNAVATAHASLTGIGVDDHHAQLHAASHENGGGDELLVNADQVQVLYVGKHGHDSYDGKTLHTAKLTFGAAITAAGTPAGESTAVTIVCLDDGLYVENLTHVPYVFIHVPNATIQGKHDMLSAGVFRLVARRVVNSTTIVQVNNAGAIVYVDTEQNIQTSDAANVIVSAGTAHLRCSHVENGDAEMILVNGANAIAYIDIEEMESVDSGAYAVRASAGKIAGRIGVIHGTGWGVSGEGDVEINLVAGEISATGPRAAIAVTNALAEVNIFCPKVTGTITETAGILRLVQAVKNDYIGTTDPGVSDDNTKGYSVGSVRINVITDKAFTCVDASTGAAIWLDGAAIGAHAATHEDGGADEIDVGGLSGLLADTQTPSAHAAAHQNGGGDEISVAGLSGELADDQPPKSHALGGAVHSTDTPANINARVTGDDFQVTSEKSAASGYASLDGSAKVPTSELPASVLGDVAYQGVWNATTNTPALASGVGTKGYYYKVSVAGSTDLDGITDWKIGDMPIFNGSTWDKIDNTETVVSVFGRIGAVVAAASDYTHAQLASIGVDDHHAQLHQAAHNSGGGDALKLDDLATPDDNTDLDASASEHGLLPKLGGGTVNFLRADGTWVKPKCDIHISIQNDGFDYKEHASATFTSVGKFAFPGTTAAGTPTTAKFIIWNGEAGGSHYARIQDVTNGQTIGTVGPFSGQVAVIQTQGTLANLPAGEAVFEIQTRDANTKKIRCSGASLI